jgi:hypothetical protein
VGQPTFVSVIPALLVPLKWCVPLIVDCDGCPEWGVPDHMVHTPDNGGAMCACPLNCGAPVRYPGQRAIRTRTIHRLHTSLESRHQDPHLRGGGMESRNCFALSP